MSQFTVVWPDFVVNFICCQITDNHGAGAR